MQSLGAWLVAGAASLAVTSTLWAQGQGGFGQGGGQGGIVMDAEGVLRTTTRVTRPTKASEVTLDPAVAARSNQRQISLKQLDRQIRQAQAGGGALPEELARLAGLVKLDYLILDRANQDIILAGPAEGWISGGGLRMVGQTSGRPVVQLEDLVTVLRCILDGDGEATCSIDPNQQGLAAINTFRVPTDTTKNDLPRLQREVEEVYGLQSIKTTGVPQGCRLALVMIEADYRMKRTAMGVESAPGVTSHFDVVQEMTERNENRRTLARWWFTPAYDAVLRDEAGTTYSLEGPALRVLNEEVMVNDAGQRRGTGASSANWDKFTTSFTEKLPQLEKKVHAYADLHNLFDLMMFAALIKEQGAGAWLRGTVFLDESAYTIPTYGQPTHAEPACNITLHGRRNAYISFVYGGVTLRPSQALAGLAPKVDAKASSVPRVVASVSPGPSGSTAAATTSSGSPASAKSPAPASAAGSAATSGSGPAGSASPAGSAAVASPAAGSWWADVK